jgi:predicted metal-binding protein
MLPLSFADDMNIEKYLSNPEIFQYKLIETNEIPFSQAVIDMCKANRCGKYGTCWTCPPGVGNLDELESKIKSYKTACVFTCKYDLEDSFDFEGMIEGQKSAKRVLQNIIEQLQADGEKFMALGCEGCGLCEKCTYPDAPCRFPEKAVPSVEACGINVVELAKKSGINYNNGADTVTYFCVILC